MVATASQGSGKREWDFARMIAPVEPVEFFRDTWEQRPLILARQAPMYHADLLSMTDIERLLETDGLCYPEIRLVKQHNLYAPEHYTWDGKLADVAKVRAEFEAGTTVVFSHINRLWEPLATLCQALEARFRVETWAELFWTPAHSQAFQPHYDPHEEFILQIDGAKHWRIYDAPIPLPLQSQPFDPSYLAGTPLLHEVTLHAGDLMYLPRGFIHEAYTTDAPSAHLTLDLDLFTWADFFAATLERVARADSRFRHSLPIGTQEVGTSAESIREQFERLLEVFVSGALPQAAMAPFAEGELLRPPGAASGEDGGHWVNLERVDVRTLVRRRAAVVGHVLADDDSVALVYGDGRQLHGPRPIEPALRFMAQASAFEVGALPGHLRDSSRLVLVRRLLKEGFLTVVRY